MSSFDSLRIVLLLVLVGAGHGVRVDGAIAKELRVGIIGLDTSHAIEFTRIVNAKEPSDSQFDGCRITVAYPQGSYDIESSTSRIAGYTKEIQSFGVEIVDSVESVVGQVDAVLLETNDGRLHLEQALPGLKAGKPTFVDKPIAATLADAIAIFDAAEHYGTPLFSSSSLRFDDVGQEVRKGTIGKVMGCDTYSPCHLEPTHPDLYWYGIHGVELLYTVMGTGCVTVRRVSMPTSDVVVGIWADQRLGTFRGLRAGRQTYGGTAFGEKGTRAIGKETEYKPLLVEVIRFFRTGVVPVTHEETIEIFAFMQAAEKSKQLDGQAVSVESVLQEARQKAAQLRSW